MPRRRLERTRTPARDRDGRSRLEDGRLDGSLEVDLGPYEYSHVDLAVTGDWTPGGAVTIATTGRAGLDVLMLVATSPGETLHRSLGWLFMGFGGAWFLQPFRTIPSTVVATIPLDVPTPFSCILQGIALVPATSIGNVSNAFVLTIE